MFTLANPGNTLRYNTPRSTPPVFVLARLRGGPVTLQAVFLLNRLSHSWSVIVKTDFPKQHPFPPKKTRFPPIFPNGARSLPVAQSNLDGGVPPENLGTHTSGTH